jgi:flavin reductase (DIM6/NTAB) family NADH-FMN oxidoreductase RutF
MMYHALITTEMLRVEAQDFKEVMARWATGISVITSADGNKWYGFTANSFASVSIEPYLISMSVAKSLYTLSVIEKSGVFAVNILRKNHIDWGMRFAGMIPEFDENRFEGLNARLSENGCPLLPDILGWMDCKVFKTVDVGASVLFLGEVTGAQWGEGEPLVYWNRQWGEFKTQES